MKKEDAAGGDHIICARCPPSSGARSVSADIEMDPGRYEILPMILATRDLEMPTVEGVVKKHAEKTPQKLKQIGLNYDIAHAKGYRVEAAVKAANGNPEKKQSGDEERAEWETEDEGEALEGDERNSQIGSEA